MPRTSSSVSLFFHGVWLSPLGTAAIIGLLYQPQMTDDGDCGAISGMKIGKGNRSTRRKPVPAPLCPPQIPHDLTRARTRTAAVGSQRLTVWAVARVALSLTLCKQAAHNYVCTFPSLKIAVIWDVTARSVVDISWRFGGNCHLQLQAGIWSSL
jgi:hypothetical protein